MSEEIIQLGVIEYEPTAAAIAKMSQTYMTLTVQGVDDKVGLAKVHEARMTVKNCRVAVEKHRKHLKADALEYGRNVDKEANRIKALLAPIEKHLTEQEDIVKREKERIKEEKEAAERAKLEERMQALEAYGVRPFSTDVKLWTDEYYAEELAKAKAAHEERLRKEEEERKAREAEAERQRIESERLEKERAELEAQKEAARKAAEEAAAERQRLADIEAEKQRAAQAEIDRQRAEIQAEKDRIKAEQISNRSARLVAANVAMSNNLVESLTDSEFDAAICKAIEDRAEQAEKDRLEANRLAEEAAERARIETEQRIQREAEEKAEAERMEAEKAARREARRPWREKVEIIAANIAQMEVPKAGKGCGDMRERVVVALDVCVSTIRGIIEEED